MILYKSEVPGAIATLQAWENLTKLVTNEDRFCRRAWNLFFSGKIFWGSFCKQCVCFGMKSFVQFYLVLEEHLSNYLSLQGLVARPSKMKLHNNPVLKTPVWTFMLKCNPQLYKLYFRVVCLMWLHSWNLSLLHI